jgi:hypothetical protein
MLTPDGEFLKSRKQKGQVDIGEEIIFFPMHRGAAEKRKLASFFKMKWAIVTMLTVAVLFLSFYPKYVNNQIYAYVSLDVNPSLELGLNKNMQVVSIDAFNEAKLLLPRLEDWKNEDLSKVSSEIMILFQQDGYLKSGGEVVIASVLADSENLVWKKKMQNELFSISQNILGENVSVTTLETTSEKRDEAIKQGVSPGKYVQNERKTELVDKDDTSKTTIDVQEDLQVVPSKVTDVEQLQVKTEKEKQENPDVVGSKEWKDSEGKQESTHKHDEIKEQRKENHDREKEEKKESREQVKEEKKDNQEKRKQEREQSREEKREEQNQRKEDRKNERGQN